MLVIKAFLINLFIAIAYLSGGVIGDLLAIEPSNSSPVWPSSGIALAVLLIYGWRILPGLVVGIFCTQIYVSFGGEISTAIETALGLLAIKAFASSAQAILGMLLIHHFVGRNDTLLDLSKILLFFFYGAIVSCVVAPTICIGVFYLQGILAADDCLFAWLTWWVGDVIGVLIFTPIILAFVAKPQSIWYPRRTTVAAPLGLLLLLLFTMFFYSKQQETKRIDTLFEHRVERVHNMLEAEIYAHKNIAENIRDFFNADEKVTKDEFYLLTRSSLRHHPDIIAIEWIPRIVGNPKSLLSTSNKVRYPIEYIEPYLINKKVVGYDVRENKKSELDEIANTGKVLLTGQFHLEYKAAHSQITSIYVPLYKKNLPSSLSKGKSDYLLGFIAVIFVIEDEKTETLLALADNQLKIEIKNNSEVIYSNFADNTVKPITFNSLEARKILRVPESIWQITFRPSEEFLSSQTTWHVWWILLGGLVLTSFIGVGLLVITGRTAHIEQQVTFKTRDLNSINNKLNQQVLLRQKLEKEQISRNEILESLAKGEDFKVILSAIVKSAEKLNPEMICTILLLDEEGKHLIKGASVSLPDFYSDAIDGLKIGDGIGSCGTAAFTGKQVIVEDIMKHPYWEPFKELAQSAGVHACWSEPVISSKKKVLGTFGIYYKTPKAPSRKNLEFIKRMAGLTAITIERKQTEDELRIAATTFQSHDAVVITDINGTILRINQAYTDITGYSEQETLGKNANILNSGMHDQAFFRALYLELEDKGRWEGEIWNRRKNGNCFPERITITAVKQNLQVTNYVGIFSDISDKKANEQEINQLAFFDPLTKLANRRLFLERLDQAMITAKRHKYFGAVIYMDLDHFKSLNDTLGHRVGDQLLVLVAERIKSVIREEDTACRLGGDEFVVLIFGYDSSITEMIEQVAIVAEKIRDKINKPFELEHGKQVFSISVGVSVFPDNVDESVEILEQADTALYRSKQSGRNRVSFYNAQMQEEHNRKSSIERMLLTALSKKQFVMYYQGQTNAKGDLRSAEALLRWNHPEQNMVSPAEFIPIAENSHLIVEIGNWVLLEVCQQIKKWQQAGFYIEHIAVNISPRQFRQKDFIKQVQMAIDTAGIQAKYLMLELTEGIVIEDINDTINKMLQIQMMGIAISIDDFGTGYSSLAYLKQMPLSQLKIDQSFVRDINVDTSDEVIVESIIALAHKLGLEVIAEGVETIEQLQFLQDKGCNKYQGYYFCKPVPAEELIKNYI